jgi:transketolase
MKDNPLKQLGTSAIDLARLHPTRPDPSTCARLAVEAGATQGWCKYVGCEGDVIGVDRFGASAPGKVMMNEYGFTVENICKRALELVNRKPVAT